jgi:thioredoxin reductase (NADPH)
MKNFFLALVTLCSSLLHAAPEEEHPVVILGGGVAALTSATYLARGGIVPLVISGPQMGGAITQSHRVQNWPSELEISGWDLAEKMRVQAEQNGAVICSESVVAVDLSSRPFLITTQGILDGKEKTRTIKAQSLIIGLGASPNMLGVPGESGSEGYFSRGVYSCAVCDGAFYKDKVVAIVGGGDSALLEAQYLSNLARKVYIIVRKDNFRAVEKERAKEILSRPNVEVIYETIVQEIRGDGDKVTELLVQNTKTKSLSTLSIDALFLAIGSKPNSELFRNQLELDEAGYIRLKNHQETSIEGVYAIGDIADPEFKQAISAAGDGAKAALQAQKFLTAYRTEVAQKAPPAPVGPAVIEITSKEHFAREIQNGEGAIFVDFYADYCGPCRMFGPTYESWAKEFNGRIKFLKVDAQKLPHLFDQYQVRGIPTMVILDAHGNVIRKVTGLQEIAGIHRKLDEVRSQSSIDPQSFKRI